MQESSLSNDLQKILQAYLDKNGSSSSITININNWHSNQQGSVITTEPIEKKTQIRNDRCEEEKRILDVLLSEYEVTGDAIHEVPMTMINRDLCDHQVFLGAKKRLIRPSTIMKILKKNFPELPSTATYRLHNRKYFIPYIRCK